MGVPMVGNKTPVLRPNKNLRCLLSLIIKNKIKINVLKFFFTSENGYYGPVWLGNNQSDTINPKGIGSRSGKVYGVAVNVQGRNGIESTVALLCRDKMYVPVCL